MSGGLPLYDLLTVKRAAEVLYKSEQGVRRLVQSGKLEALRDGGKLLVKAESLAAYVAGLPHPVDVTEALHTARNLLGGAERYRQFAGGALELPSLEQHPDKFMRLCVAPSLPVCRDILAAVNAGDYERARALRAELWRISTDYHMLHAPFETPRVKPGKGGKQEHAQAWDLPSLFPELEGGKG